MISIVQFIAMVLILAPLETTGFVTPSTTACRKQDYKQHIPSSTALQGIPKMFRWLTDQYPDVLNRQLENGLSDELVVDNFYLDMNGIIHPCTHGNNEGEIVILDETAMFKKIFLYVDRYVKQFVTTDNTQRAVCVCVCVSLHLIHSFLSLLTYLLAQTIQIGTTE